MSEGAPCRPGLPLLRAALGPHGRQLPVLVILPVGETEHLGCKCAAAVVNGRRGLSGPFLRDKPRAHTRLRPRGGCTDSESQVLLRLAAKAEPP